MAGRMQAVFMGEIIVFFLTSPRARAFNSLTGTQEYRMVGALDTNYTEFKPLNRKTFQRFLPCRCVLSSCQHSRKLLRNTVGSHYHELQQRDVLHY